MRARRHTATLAAMITIGLFTAGCGLSGGSSGSAADKQTTVGNCTVDPANVGTGALTGAVKGQITFQTTNLKKDFGDYFNGVISAFEQAHPGTTVKWIDDPGDATFTQRLVADAQACTLPDVVNLNSNTAIALTKVGYLLNLTQKAPTAGTPFVPAIWNSSTMTDATGAQVHTVLPWYSGALVQTFNTTLMTKAGLNPAQAPTTIFELFDDAETIAKASGGKYYALLANPAPRIPSDWQQMGVPVLADDGKSFVFAGNPTAIEWVTRLRDLYKAGAMPKDSLSQDQDPSTLFGDGRLVFGSTNASFLRFIEQNSPSVYKQTGVAQYPLDKLGHTSAAGQYIAVPATSKNAPTALAFAEFLTNAENQLAWAKDPDVVVYPATSASLDDPFFTKVTGDDAFAAARKIGAEDRKTATAYEIPMSPAELNAIVAQVQLAMQGKVDPAKALENAQTKANELLAQGS